VSTKKEQISLIKYEQKQNNFSQKSSKVPNIEWFHMTLNESKLINLMFNQVTKSVNQQFLTELKKVYYLHTVPPAEKTEI